MFYGTQSDKIRFEENFRANAKKYRDAGDTTSMTDWEVYFNSPITDSSVDWTLYYRKRLNHDGTYEVLHVEKDMTRRDGINGYDRYWDSGLYYAKLVTINVNEDSPAKHGSSMDFPWSEHNTVWEEDIMYSECGLDTGAAYLYELLIGTRDLEKFPGLNVKGETVTAEKDCFCTEEELRTFAGKLGIDIGFKIPNDVYEHLDPEHNYE